MGQCLVFVVVGSVSGVTDNFTLGQTTQQFSGRIEINAQFTKWGGVLYDARYLCKLAGFLRQKKTHDLGRVLTL